MAARNRLAARVRAEWSEPSPPALQALTNEILLAYGEQVEAILFYGSCLRRRTLEGLIDLYVVVDRYPAGAMGTLATMAARLLPPTIHRHSAEHEGRRLDAKVAIITFAQLRRAIRAESRDATLWARFSQPTALAYARAPGVVEALTDVMVDALLIAGLWAARLGPPTGTAASFWQALFAATYAAELRVETTERIAEIFAAAPPRYAAVLMDAWQAQGLGSPAAEAIVNPIAEHGRLRARRAWRRRRWLGRTLNGLRLVKAAFTFTAGAEYIAWKIERHSGRPIRLTRFQRRHPLLAAPSLLLMLARARVIR